MASSTQAQIQSWANFESSFNTLAIEFDDIYHSLISTEELLLQRELINQLEEKLENAIEELQSVELHIKQLPYNLRCKAQGLINSYTNQIDQVSHIFKYVIKYNQQGKAYNFQENPENLTELHNISLALAAHANLTRTSSQNSNKEDHDNTKNDQISINVNSTNNPSLNSITPSAKPTKLTQYKEQRSALLDNATVIHSTNDSLDRTAISLAETTEYGIQTALQLQQQREIFLRQRATIYETDSLLGKSKKTLERMRRRILTDKLIQILIIFFELVIIALIVWIKYFMD
jgi:hypothetical protein